MMGGGMGTLALRLTMRVVVKLFTLTLIGVGDTVLVRRNARHARHAGAARDARDARDAADDAA